MLAGTGSVEVVILPSVLYPYLLIHTDKIYKLCICASLNRSCSPSLKAIFIHVMQFYSLTRI